MNFGQRNKPKSKAEPVKPPVRPPVKVPPEIEALSPEARKTYLELKENYIGAQEWVDKMEVFVVQCLEEFKKVRETLLNHKEGLEAMDARLKAIEDSFQSAEDHARHKGRGLYLG